MEEAGSLVIFKNESDKYLEAKLRNCKKELWGGTCWTAVSKSQPKNPLCCIILSIIKLYTGDNHDPDQ